jgi:proline racemase
MGAIDRSPCGTGTCAKMATLYARGELRLNEDFRHEGILGTIFTGRLVEETTVGPYPAVVPTLGGQAWITGFAQYVLERDDPFPMGFTLGDIWAAATVGYGLIPRGSPRPYKPRRINRSP